MRTLRLLSGLLPLVLAAQVGLGQTYQQFQLNSGLQATNSDRRAVLALWDRYLGSDFEQQNQFWSPKELQRYRQGDLLLSEGYVNPNVYKYTTQKLVLSVEPLDSTLYQCRTLFYWQSTSEPGTPLTAFCIVNTNFEKQNQQWVMVNYLTRYTRQWRSNTVGYITYYLPPNRPLDKAAAEQANAFLKGLYRDFDIDPFPVTYYVAGDCAEVQRMKGFDFVIGMGNDRVCGFYDQVNHLIYAGGLGEGYLHELVHVINPFFPQAHPLLLTGYAALRGGHFGHPLSYHKERVWAYLKTHPVDLQNPLLFTSLDEQTNPQYVVGGILCEAALRTGGIPKLKRLFTYGTSDEAFYKALKQEFGVDRKALPAFILRCLRTR